MADLKSVAGLFGMTVSELEQFTGYSRQELHRVMNNGKAVGTARMSSVIRKLDAASYDTVSYTHLDVYKRQLIMFSTGTGKEANTLNKAKINLTDDTLKNILIMAPMLDEIGQNRVCLLYTSRCV